MKQTATKQNEFSKIYFFTAALLNDKKAAGHVLEEISAGLRNASPEPVDLKSFYRNVLRRCAAPGKEPLPEQFYGKTSPADAVPSESAAEEIPGPELLRNLMQCILQLPGCCRVPFLAFYYAHLSICEISDTLSVPEEEVRLKLSAANGAFCEKAKEFLQDSERNDGPINAINLLPDIFLQAEQDVLLPVRSKKKIWIAAAASVAVLALALLLILLNFPQKSERESVISATGIPTAAPATITAPPTSYAPVKTAVSTLPPPTAAPNPPPNTVLQEFAVLTGLEYDNGKRLYYTYTDTAVTAKDSEGNTVLVLEFDADGRLIRKSEHKAALGRFSDRIRIWEFDKSGNIANVYHFGFGPATEETFQYDTAGNLLSAGRTFGNLENSVFEYEADGTPRRQTETHKDGSVTEYRYDKSGRITEEKFYDVRNRSGKLTYEIHYEYDESGRMTKMTQNYYDISGKNVENIRTEEYDVNGNTVRSVFRKKTGEIISSDYVYDETGQWIRQESVTETDYYKKYSLKIGSAETNYTFYFDKENKTLPAYRYQKNSDGWYTIQEVTYEWKLGVRYEDEYDGNGNLTKRTYYDEENLSDNYYFCEYDALNRKTAEYHYQSECCGDYSYAFYYTYEYDDAGNVSRIVNRKQEEYCFDAEGRMTQYISGATPEDKIKITYFYTDKGVLSRKILEFTERPDAISVQYDYDETGNLTDTVYRFGNTESIYDKSGDKRKETTYGETGAVLSVRDFTYHADGKIVEIREFDGNQNRISRTEYQYDQNGVLTDWTKYDEEKRVLFRYQNRTAGDRGGETAVLQGSAEYDRNGNLIQLTSYDGTGKRISGIFTGETKEIYSIYSKCNIADLIPEGW